MGSCCRHSWVELAQLAVADTGIGNVDDKFRKNQRKTLGLLRDLHGVLAYGLFGLVLMHAGAALYHGFVRRDDVLPSMLHGDQSPPPLPATTTEMPAPPLV